VVYRETDSIEKYFSFSFRFYKIFYHEYTFLPPLPRNNSLIMDLYDHDLFDNYRVIYWPNYMTRIGKIRQFLHV